MSASLTAGTAASKIKRSESIKLVTRDGFLLVRSVILQSVSEQMKPFCLCGVPMSMANKNYLCVNRPLSTSDQSELLEAASADSFIRQQTALLQSLDGATNFTMPPPPTNKKSINQHHLLNKKYCTSTFAGSIRPDHLHIVSGNNMYLFQLITICQEHFQVESSLWVGRSGVVMANCGTLSAPSTPVGSIPFDKCVVAPPKMLDWLAHLSVNHHEDQRRDMVSQFLKQVLSHSKDELESFDKYPIPRAMDSETVMNFLSKNKGSLNSNAYETMLLTSEKRKKAGGTGTKTNDGGVKEGRIKKPAAIGLTLKKKKLNKEVTELENSDFPQTQEIVLEEIVEDVSGDEDEEETTM